jgi:penicillin amidase
MARIGRWIAALLLLIVAGGGSLLLATLPPIDGRLRLHGLAAPVEIDRDAAGIVTIRAQSEADAAFALGFAHAQDRLFQMDMTRRYGAGRLSEVIGAATLPTDRFMRRLGLYRVAQANYLNLPAEAQRLFQAYAAGVNAYIAENNNLLPPEFLLLGYRPEPWHPADSLVWGRLMAWQLSGNWRDE